MTLRILLLDEHRMLTEALAARLAGPDLVVDTRHPGGAQTVVAHARRARPDVVVLEIVPLDDDRRELLLGLRRRVPDAHVVALTADVDPETAAEAARLGVEGWISKEAGVDDLAAMVRAAADGHAWYPPEQLAAALDRLRAEAGRRRAGDPLGVLTDREREILAAMTAGESTTTLADRLHVSAHTVRTHVGSIYQKLGVHSRLEAVAAARAAGLEPASGPGSALRPARVGDRPETA